MVAIRTMERETYPLLSLPVTKRLAINNSKFKRSSFNFNKNTNLDLLMNAQKTKDVKKIINILINI